MTTYDLYTFLTEELGNGSSDLVTRPSGQAVRQRIEKRLLKEESGKVVALDFSQIGIIDYSCADEIVAKLVSRLLGNEYGDKYLLLTGLNENQLENIEVALERKCLAVIVEDREGKKLLLGKLNNYLRETLSLIVKKGRITARELADTVRIESNTSGTRLLNLHKKRLVLRRDEMKDGARVWVYESL